VRVDALAGLPAGVARVAVRAGSAYDPPGREGLAFVTAHAIAAQVEGTRVTVGPDVVRFELPVGGLPDLGRAMVADPPPAALGQAVAVAREALVPRDCAQAAELAWRVAAYAGHPYGHAEAGRTSVLPTLTAVEAGNLARARYVREAARVALGGDTPEARAAAAAALEGLPVRLSRSPVPAPRPVTELRRVAVAARIPVATGEAVSVAAAASACTLTRARFTPAPSPRHPDLLSLALELDPGALAEELWSDPLAPEACASPAEPGDCVTVVVHPLPSGAVEGSAAPDVISLEDLLR
jgi:hypothetical protein